MQELEKILEEIDAEFDRRIDIQLKIMAGLGDDVYRYGYGKSLEAYQQGKLFVEDIIRKHMAGGWIPVEERLPENDDFVLVTVTGIYNALTFSDAIQLASYCKGDGWFVEGYPDWENPNISAWRPLPEPYRLERSGE